MTNQNAHITERKRDAILGAAIADAATLGFHWLYDQDRIKTLAPAEPEFRQPSPADYANVAGYLAHAHKTVGELSQYGEQHKTMLGMLAQNKGVYDKANYETAFTQCFGYGGSYHGYIDHPTRDTLNNITLAQNKAIERATNLPFNRSADLKRKLITKILGCVKEASGEQLRKNVETTVRRSDDSDYLVEHAFKMLDEWESVNGFHGADDTQLPALAKLPSLVAAYTQHDNLTEFVDSAVRVTNNNDKAVAFGQACAKIMESAIITGNPDSAIEAGLKGQASEMVSLIEQALSTQTSSTPEVTAQWGMACQLNIGFPSAIHNIANSASFTEAIRQNIYAGGDSCGRSILIGSVLGACYGVGGDKGIPEQWITKLKDQTTIEASIDDLLKALA